jgi:outer membrane murein-binding lipoprotein Lpp
VISRSAPVTARSEGGRSGACDRLEGHVQTLNADVERLEAQLAGAAADLAAEREKTDKAIAAFAALAERPDALAAERSRPWWRRLAG